jgi:hypothetical protein
VCPWLTLGGPLHIHLERAPVRPRQLHLALGGHPRVRALRARGILPLRAMNENFSLIVMCLFLLGSLAFLAQQLTSYH